METRDLKDKNAKLVEFRITMYDVNNEIIDDQTRAIELDKENTDTNSPSLLVVSNTETQMETVMVGYNNSFLKNIYKVLNDNEMLGSFLRVAEEMTRVKIESEKKENKKAEKIKQKRTFETPSMKDMKVADEALNKITDKVMNKIIAQAKDLGKTKEETLDGFANSLMGKREDYPIKILDNAFARFKKELDEKW